MKKKMKTILWAITFCLLLIVPAAASGKDGWQNMGTTYTQYYRNEMPVTGIQTINGKVFYFDSKGYLKRNSWVYVGADTYRTNSHGQIIKKRIVKLGEKSYCFYSDGRLRRNAWVYIGKNTYRTNSHGQVITKILVKLDENHYSFYADGNLRRNAWVSVNGKTYRTNSHGMIIKNKLVKLDGKVYYFKANGRLMKGWMTFKAGKSYFNSDGSRCTGEKRIGGKTYLFYSNGNLTGYLMTGKTSYTSGNTTYYLDGKGVVEMKVVKTGGTEKYYNTAGKQMSNAQGLDYVTFQTAKGIAASITNSSMTMEQKLQTCFDWVIRKPYITWRQFSSFDGWIPTYANDHFLRGGGNCQSDAAAFAYLAKAIGYTEIYVCVDSDGTNPNGHSWTEINGKVYDPLFAEAKNYYAYYGASYASYVLYPILHIKL